MPCVMLPGGLILLAVIIAEAPSSARRTVTFDGALGLAATTPNVVATARASREKEDLDRHVAAVPFNPQVSIMPGWRFAPSDARQPELIVEILQPWNLSGQGQARRRTIAREEEVLRAEARVAALASRLSAARAWLDLWAAERVFDETQREEQIAAELERLVARAASLGAMTRADVAEARAYHAEARVAVLGAEGESFNRGLALGRELGDRDAVPLGSAGALPAAPVPPSSRRAEYVERMSGLPGVALRDLQARAVSARELEERAARGVLAQLGAVVQRDAPGGLVVSGLARVTLPLIDRGERERAGMRAEAARLEGERGAALLAARTELAASFHEVEHTAEVLAVLRDDLVPASRSAAELRRRIFQSGGATLLEVLQSERVAVAAASRAWRIQAEHAWARAKLWLLVAEVALRDPKREGGP